MVPKGGRNFHRHKEGVFVTGKGICLLRWQRIGSRHDEGGLEKEREALFSFLGLPLPRATALGVGRILGKITRKRFASSCRPEASQMLPCSDIPRIPARERTILRPATCLGPVSGCNCRSDLARQGKPTSSPGGRDLGAPWDPTLGAAAPWLWKVQQP